MLVLDTIRISTPAADRYLPIVARILTFLHAAAVAPVCNAAVGSRTG